MAEVSEHPQQALGETKLRNLDEVGNPGFDRKKKKHVQFPAPGLPLELIVRSEIFH